MKVDKLAVIVSNKKGDCYQVLLNDKEQLYIKDLISQLHEGKINASGTKLAVTLGDSDNTDKSKVEDV